MVAAVEPPHRDHFERHADHERGGEREHGAEHEAAGQRREGRGEIGADHVERAVRQVDQIHDAEDQRQPRRQQEQQHAKLDAVEALLDEIQHGSVTLTALQRSSPKAMGPSRSARTSRQKRRDASAAG